MKFTWQKISIVLSILVLNFSFASATTYYRSSPTAIVGSADHILVGRVVKIPEEKKEGKVEIQIVEELKGKLEKDIINLSAYDQRYHSFWTSYESEQLYLLFIQIQGGELKLVSDINITSTSGAAPPISIQLGTCRPVSGLNDPAVYTVKEILKTLEPNREDPTAGLIPLLTSLDHDEKRMAISQLLKIDNPKAQNELEKLFPSDNWLHHALYSADKKDKLCFLTNVSKSDDPKKRGAAILRVDWIGEDALPILRNAIRDPDANVRLAAIRQIRKLGKPEDAMLIGKFLKDPDFATREATAVSLGMLKVEESIPFLVDAICETEDEYLCLLYAESIAEILCANAVPELINVIKSSASVQTEISCIRALGRLKAKTAVPILIAGLKDSNSLKRYYSAISLGLCGNETAIPHLIKCLDDENENIRWAAVEALGKIGDKQSVPHLIRLLKDENSRVKESAIIALGKIGEYSAVPTLIKILDDKQKCGEWREGVLLISDYVRESLGLITGRVPSYALYVTEQERESAIKEWKDWWEQNKGYK